MTSSLVFGIFLLIIGLVVGGLVTALLMGRENRQTGEGAGEEYAQKYQELVRLWRDRENGNMLVEIAGEIYENTENMDEKNLNRMLIIADKLDVFLGRQKSETPVSQQVQKVESDKETAVFPGETQEVLESETRAKNLEMLKPPVKEEESPRPAFSSLPPVPDEMVSAEPKAVTMIEQINEILQLLIPISPIAGKNVRISEDPFKGVIVWVGLDKYEGIDDVPDKNIRIVIRAAVAEWEKHADSRRK